MPKKSTLKSAAKSIKKTALTTADMSPKRAALEQKAWYRLLKVATIFLAGVYMLGVLMIGLLISREYTWVDSGMPVNEGTENVIRMQRMQKQWGGNEIMGGSVRSQNYGFRGYEARFNAWRFVRFVVGGWGLGAVAGWLISKAFFYVVLGKE